MGWGGVGAHLHGGAVGRAPACCSQAPSQAEVSLPLLLSPLPDAPGVDLNALLRLSPPAHRNLAFVKDPDGYWIEILTPDNAPQFVNWQC